MQQMPNYTAWLNLSDHLNNLGSAITEKDLLEFEIIMQKINLLIESYQYPEKLLQSIALVYESAENYADDPSEKNGENALHQITLASKVLGDYWSG